VKLRKEIKKRILDNDSILASQLPAADERTIWNRTLRNKEQAKREREDSRTQDSTASRREMRWSVAQQAGLSSIAYERYIFLSESLVRCLIVVAGHCWSGIMI
jgi:hypothetical protein